MSALRVLPLVLVTTLIGAVAKADDKGDVPRGKLCVHHGVIGPQNRGHGASLGA
jgi:hypothetical protein